MRRPWLDPQSLDGPLRGKSPIIVFADTDLKEAARQSTAGIFFNAGQVCSAGSRILVDDRIHDEFVDRRAIAGHRRYVGSVDDAWPVDLRWSA